MKMFFVAPGRIDDIGVLVCSVEERQRNPNQRPASSQLGNAVEVRLEPNRQGHYLLIGQINRKAVTLLVDTGADRIVVPKSLITPLGFDPDQLEITRLQTVNGTLEAQVGKLSAISLNNQIINDVDIAFVDDNLLGNVMLLGMNVLSQYRMILDHESNQITLIEK